MYDPRQTSEAQTLPPDYPIYRVEHQRPRRRSGCWQGCFAIGGAFFAFSIVAVIVSVIVAKPIYQNMEPLDQEIWCNRAERVAADFVCEWKPTPPFQVLPTLPGSGQGDISPEDLLKTPFDFNSGTPVGTPVSLDGTFQAPPNLPSVTPTFTQLPTGSPSITPAPTLTSLPPTFTATPIPASSNLVLSLLRPEAQRWNNCGPTTLTMGLSYFGYTNNQSIAADYLKPNIEDKNVSPWQMIDFVNKTAVNMVGTKAIFRVGGDLALLKRLIAAGFPVIIEKGYEIRDLGWMGHYLLLVGYDDSRQIFLTFDSYLGTNGGKGREETYQHIDTYWRQFNRTYIVIYTPDREQELGQLLGDAANPDAAWQTALNQARADATANSSDKWAWLNMGEALVALKQYNEATTAFDQAFQLQLPFRTLWYRFGAFEAYYQAGRYDDVLRLSDAVDRSSGYYVEEAWYYKGLVFAARGNNSDALEEFERVLRFNANHTLALQAKSAVETGAFVAPTVN